ncbi:MAG: hypothetical protein K9N51_00595 [Candidatus Pacebacteria bacterium]|nr:hypothetical protein [Candidatus Paceibacterota bacterium]
MASIRKRLEAAVAGRPVEQPVYAVYDWFVRNRLCADDWGGFFEKGLGQINHANVIRHEHPNFERVETVSRQNGEKRTDVRIVTDRGELHEWYLGEWKQEHFIKTPEDYRIMARALEGVTVLPDDTAFLESERTLGDGGITVGQLPGLGLGRTALVVLQIDWVGLEQWSLDLAMEEPAMMELLEVMSAIKLDEIRCAAQSPAQQIKLWENLSVETMGPRVYQRYLAPFYRDILAILDGAGKRLQVHYDGSLKVITDEIAALDFDGIDSFTEPPEGDMSTREARQAWPDTFLWQNINLGWYELPEKQLAKTLERVLQDAGPTRHCFMISEDIPGNWRESIPAVMDILNG